MKEVYNVIQELWPLVPLPEDVQNGLSIAFKGILQKPKPPSRIPLERKREKRPALVVEDLYDLIQDGHEDF